MPSRSSSKAPHLPGEHAKALLKISNPSWLRLVRPQLPRVLITLPDPFWSTQEALAPATYNLRLAALRSFSSFLSHRGWLAEALLEGVERKPERPSAACALDAQKVESVLCGRENPRDRALFWLIYDGGLFDWRRRRCLSEAECTVSGGYAYPPKRIHRFGGYA